MISAILFILCAIPLSVHIFDDRHGDNRKLNDLLALSAVSLLMAWIYFKLGIDPLRTLAAIFGWHFFLFDYLIVAVLRKNEVIRSDARWFSYVGKSAKLDRLWGKLKPAQRFAIRLAVFVGAVVIWFV